MKVETLKRDKPNLSEAEIAAIRASHEKCMEDPIYKAGFEAAPKTSNPYPFPTEIDAAKWKIAIKPGNMTQRDDRTLAKLNKNFAETPWARWATGELRRLAADKVGL